MSNEENSTLTVLDRLRSKLGLINGRRRAKQYHTLASAWSIKAAGPSQSTEELSGGNQQKVVLARALASDPAVLVLIHPTAGVDVTAQESIYRTLGELTKTGCAVVICSADDVDLAICDRVSRDVQGRKARRDPGRLGRAPPRRRCARPHHRRPPSGRSGSPRGRAVMTRSVPAVPDRCAGRRLKGEFRMTTTSQTGLDTTGAAPKSSPLDRVSWLRELVLLPVIVVAIIIGAIVTPRFLTVNNIVNNVLVVSAVLGMVVIAESIILISGYFDLSLESVVGLGPMLAVWLVMPAAVGGLGWELSPTWPSSSCSWSAPPSDCSTVS